MAAASNSAIAPWLYQPLKTSATSHDEQEIRVLSITSPISKGDISCKLQTIPLGRAKDNFFALSYVWGDASDTVPILVDGQVFQATRNLVEALHHVPAVEPRCKQALWVDAICINQHDIPERNSQVSMMGYIYKYAHEVLCWLGPRDDTSDYIIQFINQLHGDIEACWDGTINFAPFHEPIYSEIIAKIQHTALFRSPVLQRRQYWERAWTFQEAILAKDCQAIAGSCSFSISALDSVVVWIHDFLTFISRVKTSRTIKYQFMRGNDEHNVPAQVWAFLQQVLEDTIFTYPATVICTERRKRRSTWFVEANYENGVYLMHVMRTRNATDARDKIYATAGLAPIGISVDYAASVQDVYVNYAKHAITKIPSVEKLLVHAGASNPDSAHAGPSWVPDWSSKGLGALFIQPMDFDMRQGAPASSRPISIAGNNLHLNGVIIEQVQRAMPYSSSDENIDIMNVEMQASFVRKAVEFYLQRQSHEILKDIITQAPKKHLYPTGISVVTAVLQLVWVSRPEKRKRDDWSWTALAPFVKLLAKQEREPTVSRYSGVLEQAEKDPRNEAILASICDCERTESISMTELMQSIKGVEYNDMVRASALVYGGIAAPFITTSGLMGYGEGLLQPGDVIFVSGSAKAPLLLRKSSTGKGYTFLSFCFVAGIDEEKLWTDVQNGINNWKMEEVVIV